MERIRNLLLGSSLNSFGIALLMTLGVLKVTPFQQTMTGILFVATTGVIKLAEILRKGNAPGPFGL